MVRDGSRETVFSPLSLHHLGEELRNFPSPGLKFDLVLRHSQSVSQSVRGNFLQLLLFKIHYYHFQISHVMYFYLAVGIFAVYPDK
jgi:hypothetical protein